MRKDGASPGRRPRPVPASDPDRLAEKRERQRRAREESLDVREKFDRAYRSFEVRNPVHGTHYRVLAAGPEPLLLCPCPDFGRRDVGTCKHVEAVRPFLEISGGPPGGPRPAAGAEARWSVIEAGLGRLPAGPWTSLAPAWRVGRLLLEATPG